jgi:hypothetical protein
LSLSDKEKLMKKLSTILFLTLLLASFLSETNKAQENKKLAQTGFQFLSVISDARGAAMAGMTSLQTGSSALSQSGWNV